MRGEQNAKTYFHFDSILLFFIKLIGDSENEEYNIHTTTEWGRIFLNEK